MGAEESGTVGSASSFAVRAPPLTPGRNPFFLSPPPAEEVARSRAVSANWKKRALAEPLKMPRFWRILPATITCGGTLKRYGDRGDTDGGKWLCNLDALRAAPGCIIYSLGSNGDFSFEIEMLVETSCEIYTFDCTVSDARLAKVLPGLDKRIHYNSVCLGERNFVDPQRRKFATLPSIVKSLGHKRIDLLKVCVSFLSSTET